MPTDESSHTSKLLQICCFARLKAYPLTRCDAAQNALFFVSHRKTSHPKRTGPCCTSIDLSNPDQAIEQFTYSREPFWLVGVTKLLLNSVLRGHQSA